MPTDPPLSLAGYVAELIDQLRQGDPVAFARLRRVVGSYRCVIRLDGEIAELSFGPAGLVAESARSGQVLDGEGTTDRSTVLDLLDGYVELTDALLEGLLHVAGTADAALGMVWAIEILLDGAARLPALQQLAERFRAQRAEMESPRRPVGGPTPRTSAWYPSDLPASQVALLRRLNLLPDDRDS